MRCPLRLCHFTRLRSNLCPWRESSKYKLGDLPDLPEIEAVLALAGTLAWLYKQHLTLHPSEFVRMAAQKDDIVGKSLCGLQVHARIGHDGSSCRFACPVFLCMFPSRA